MAVTTARGVAKVIKGRIPACTGAHWPVQPHHFRHVQDAVVPPQPRQHLPARQPQTCVPCNQTRQAAALGDRTPGDPDIPGCALALGDRPRGNPEIPECALGTHGARCTPQAPNPGGGTNTNEALAVGHESD